MKGTLTKKINGTWVVRVQSKEQHECSSVIEHGQELPLHPYQDELKMVMILNVPVSEFEGKEVEFEIEDFWETGLEKVIRVAELINKEEGYPELEGTMNLCEDIVSKRKINLEEMPKEEWDEARNLAYKHFNIDDICEYSGLRSVTSYTETNEPLYTEEQVRELISLIRTELAKNQYNHYSIDYNQLIQSLKQPKQ